MRGLQRKTAATNAMVNGGNIEKQDSYFIQKNSKSNPLRQEIIRLHTAGFGILPIGAGEDGKKPLLGYKNTPQIPLRNALGAMYDKGSQMYAVRLPGLLVVDIDTDTPEAHAYVEQHFGASTVQVKTPRGMHHYYHLPKGTPIPKSVRLDKIAIDFKGGMNSYVAGPMSIRPDGGQYIPVSGVLGTTHLPVFQNRSKARKSQGNRIWGLTNMPE